MNCNEINIILKEFKSERFKYTAWIIANINETVQSEESFIKHTNFSEFFSKAEFASIASAIISIFGYVRIFYSETEFINHVISKKESLNTNNIIVFNFSRDGIHEGKKSLIPAFCNLFGIKYLGSNPFVISLLRNKFIYTTFLRSVGIPVPISALYYKNGLMEYKIFKEASTLIIKNNQESASIGMTDKCLIQNWKNKDINYILNYQCSIMNTDKILIQEFIEGIECEVFVVKYKHSYHAFPPIKIAIHNSKIITNEISDTYDYSFSLLSLELNDNICRRIMQKTELAAKYLNIDDYARFDYRINTNGNFYLIDIAGSPYLTRHSSINYLFTEVLGFQYSDIFLYLSAISIKNYSQDVNCKSDSNKPLDL